MKKLMTVVLAMLFAASTSVVFAQAKKGDDKKTDGKAKATAAKTDGKAKAAEVKKDEPKKDGKKGAK